MTKNVNGDVYSDLITSADNRAMNGDSNRTKIDRIVIHHNATTNKDVAINTWLASGSAGTSAHYEITPNEIVGCVGENMVAYHAGDYPTNQRSIGLEHLNSTGAPTWQIDDATYENSAKLIADICQRYDLPINSTTIQPHHNFSSTACPGGIDVDRLIRRANEIAGGSESSSNSEHNSQPSATQPDQILNVGDKFSFTNQIYRVDELKMVHGFWQFISYELAGGSDATWDNNGIPAAIVSEVTEGTLDTSGQDQVLQVGSWVKFDKTAPWTVLKNDPNSNGVQFDTNGYGPVWVDATSLVEI